MKSPRIPFIVLVSLWCGAPVQAVLLSESYNYSGINTVIPDGVLSGLANQQSVSSSIESITSVTITLQVSGGFNGDLYGYVSQGSALAVLLNREGRTAGNSAGYFDSGLNVTFSDTASNGDIHTYRSTVIPAFGTALTGTWQPDARNVSPLSVTNASAQTASLGVFNSLNPDGTWTLFLADVNSASAAATPSTLVSWGIQIQGQGYGSMAYDANTSTTSVQDGSGDGWNTSATNWWDGSANAAWSNTIYDTAVFGAANGAAGTVAVGTVTANGITFNAAGSGNYTLVGGTITLGGNTPTITTNANATIGSVITGSSLQKTGAGTLTLTGNNSYTGTTTVSNGTLVINGNQSAATGAVTVSSGATLKGSGTVGGNTTISGTHAPGAVGTPGQQTFAGTLTYNSGSIFEWDLNAEAADPGANTSNEGTYGQVATAGTVSGTAAFKIVLGTNSFTDAFWDTNKTWTNIFTGSGMTTGTLASLFATFDTSTGVDSSGVVAGQGRFTFNGSNTLIWTAVPEPTSALAGVLIGAGMLRRRRR